MFLQRQLKINNSHKHRLNNYVHLNTRSQLTYFNFFRSNIKVANNHLQGFHYFMYATTGGFLQSKTLNYFFSYAKKLFKILKKSTKIWINLPLSHIITKKPLNTRMGKGKGSRQGLVSRVWPDTLIFAISFSRFGLVKKLFRFVKAKSPFRVVLIRNSSYFFNKTGLVKNFKATPVSSSAVIRRGVLTSNQKKFKLTLKRRVQDAIYDIFNLLTKIKKMKLLLYFYRVFPIKSRHLTYITTFFIFKNFTFYNTLFLILFSKPAFFNIDAFALLRLFSMLSVF